VLIDGVPVLSGDLLAELEDCWREQRAPIVEHLQPGLDEAAMRTLARSTGVSMEGEAA
jgi:hypothetical protein